MAPASKSNASKLSLKKAKTVLPKRLSTRDAHLRLVKPLRAKTGKQHRATEQDRFMIKSLHEQGKSISQIARTVDIGRSSVSRMLKNGCPLKRSYKKRARTSLTPSALKAITKVQKEHEKKRLPLTNRVWCAKARRFGWRKANIRTLRHAKHLLGLETRLATIKKRTVLTESNKVWRVNVAKERARLTKDQLRRCIWIDESEGQLEVRRYHVRHVDNHEPIIDIVPDPKNEKVHFLIAVGNGQKAFEHLPLKRPVLKDKKGNTVRRTLATGRRPKGQTDEQKAENLRLNQPNEGMTWNGRTLLPIFEKWAETEWFKTCYGVIIDNAKAHSEIVKFLKSKKIRVLSQPANSPDMNDVEQVHQTVKQRAIDLTPTNNHELLAAFKKVFNKFTLDEFDKYLDSYREKTLPWIIENGGEISPF